MIKSSNSLRRKFLLIIFLYIIVFFIAVTVMFFLSQKSNLNSFIIFIIYIFILNVSLVAVIYLFISIHILKPIKHLINDVKNITDQDDFSIKLDVNRKDEIGELKYEFSSILKQLDFSRKKFSGALSELSEIDWLTNVGNKQGFDKKIIEELNRASRLRIPFSLMLIDIDNFKYFIDKYGLQKGDQCLIFISKAIRETFKRAGDYIARYGGEKFAVILPNTDTKGALIVAEKLQRKVYELNLSGETLTVSERITISIGVSSTISKINSSQKELIQNAEEALMDAKNDGKNRIRLVKID
ncbi:MAG: GGDEF domain-containing protein [Spirochaetes bacterium]|nr:GGDEF domain-containing protein [Spirochaetota bacterium]